MRATVWPWRRHRLAGLAFRCGTCNGTPAWTLTRIGDVVTTWACRRHLSGAAAALLGKYERTEIQVRQMRGEISG